MQLQCIAPEGFAAERVVSECLSALFEHSLRMARNFRIEPRPGSLRRRAFFRSGRSDHCSKKSNSPKSSDDHACQLHPTLLPRLLKRPTGNTNTSLGSL